MDKFAMEMDKFAEAMHKWVLRTGTYASQLRAFLDWDWEAVDWVVQDELFTPDSREFSVPPPMPVPPTKKVKRSQSGGAAVTMPSEPETPVAAKKKDVKAQKTRKRARRPDVARAQVRADTMVPGSRRNPGRRTRKVIDYRLLDSVGTTIEIPDVASNMLAVSDDSDSEGFEVQKKREIFFFPL